MSAVLRQPPGAGHISMDRRLFLSVLASGLVAPDRHHGAQAAPLIGQLDILAPSPRGSGSDQAARAVADGLGSAGLVGTPTVVNGADSLSSFDQFVGAERGRPGVMMAAGLSMVGALIVGRARQDLATATPIARLITEYEAVAVPTGSPLRSLNALLDTLTRDPHAIHWNGGIVGGTDHVLAALIAKSAGVPASRVAYNGVSGGIGAVDEATANEGGCVVGGWSEIEPQVASGRLRALGISAPQRIPGVNVPTLIEQGIRVELSIWRGLFAPPDIAEDERRRLIALSDELVTTPNWKATLYARNWTSFYLSGEAFGGFVRQETQRMRETLGALGLT